MQCPSCGNTLREQRKETVTVDFCTNCGGMWLDHGELEKLVEIETERGGKYRSYYDDDDDDDDDDRGSGRRDADGRPRKKRGFLANLMESLGGD